MYYAMPILLMSGHVKGNTMDFIGGGFITSLFPSPIPIIWDHAPITYVTLSNIVYYLFASSLPGRVALKELFLKRP